LVNGLSAADIFLAVQQLMKKNQIKLKFFRTTIEKIDERLIHQLGWGSKAKTNFYYPRGGVAARHD
jgi:hypothetical protein